MGQLDDKVAIVTGAARGLGRAYAETMAGEGAAILACDINSCQETVERIKDAGGRAVAAETDISSMDSCAAMAERAGFIKRFRELLFISADIPARCQT